jgi:hypothetical protein
VSGAPGDLLGFRARVQQETGLGPNDVGIVGNGAHRKTGGYHEGKDVLVANGLWSRDYSVRLTRDRNAATNRASAVDVGCGWRQGRAAWIRWNNLLVAALHHGDPALRAVRAVNYSPDGTAKRRTDREAGFSVVPTTDTVTVHTHIEFYRDTEGDRQAALDRIVALIQQAASGDDMATIDDVYNLLTRAFNGFTDDGNPITKNLVGKWVSGLQAGQTAQSTQLAAIAAKVGAPVQVTLADAQLEELAAVITGHVDTPLGDADIPVIITALKDYYEGLNTKAA